MMSPKVVSWRFATRVWISSFSSPGGVRAPAGFVPQRPVEGVSRQADHPRLHLLFQLKFIARIFMSLLLGRVTLNTVLVGSSAKLYP